MDRYKSVSEMQQQQYPSTGIGKNPNLSQYRNDISAKQREIRQRLNLNPNSNYQDNPYRTSREVIPSIDDDDEDDNRRNEIVENYTRAKYKSQISYFDDEAEASLQFFKKNLLPNNREQTSSNNNNNNLADKKKVPETSQKPMKVIQNQPSEPSPTGIRASKLKQTSNDNSPYVTRSSLATNDRYDIPKIASNIKQSNSQYQIGTVKPVPFKQNSMNNEQPTLATGSSFAKRNLPSQSDHQSPIQARVGNYLLKKPSTEEIPPPIAKDSNRQLRQRSSSGGAKNSVQTPKEWLEQTNIVESSTKPATKDGLRSPEGRRTPDSPNPSGSFSRKPLYNSLLRAHDSIRLKVNRPKVRPKSGKADVEDTAVDSIPLANMGPAETKRDSNERAVDVKRSSSRKNKSKKKQQQQSQDSDSLRENESSEKKPIRNFSEVRVITIIRNENERSLGVTVRAEDGNIVVARILAGSLADKQGALQVGDLILSVNGREVYTPEQLQEQLRKTINEDTVLMKIVPSYREELPTLCIYFRALFNYDANEDTLLPCKEVGVSFNQGDILEVVNQEDPNWWQARRVDSENLQTGLIPSQELEERRRAFVIPDYDLATKTSIFGSKVSRKSKKKEIYNVGQNCDFDKAELQLYEEVCRTPAFERRTLVLIGANGVGKQALKARLVSLDPERFGTPLPHTSRLPRDGEEDGVHYHFVTRERMEEDIIDGKYLEFGEYDGALYGTKLDSIREIIGSGRVCVLDCSPTCLKILKTSDYLPFVAFIAAPTLDQMRYVQDWARGGGAGSKTYTTFDRALSRQSRRAKTLQDFAFDFFEDEELQVTVEESARLFRVYENYFDIVLVNNNFAATFQQLKDAIDALSMAPQWIPISWIYGT